MVLKKDGAPLKKMTIELLQSINYNDSHYPSISLPPDNTTALILYIHQYKLYNLQYENQNTQWSTSPFFLYSTLSSLSKKDTAIVSQPLIATIGYRFAY